MTDYGHPLEFGLALEAGIEDPHAPVRLARLAEEAGLDLVTVGNPEADAGGPAEPWTVLGWIAGRTSRIRLAATGVRTADHNAAVLARAAASLDLLGGGRVELGLTGEDTDDSELVEALTIIRGMWDAGRPGRLHADGSRHRVAGAERGPAPARHLPIHLSGDSPEQLDLVGRHADGWLVPAGIVSLDRLTGAHEAIDTAAIAAGRDPREVRRILTLTDMPDLTGRGGGPHPRVADLVALIVDGGVATILLATGDVAGAERFARVVVPAVRAAAATRRTRAGTRVSSVVPTRVRRRRREGIDYDAVPTALRADAVEPGDAGYGAVRSNYVRGGAPGLVLRPRSAGEVALALEWARTQPVDLGVRSGGHGFSGRSTNDGGIVIDLGHLRSIDVLDERTRLVRIEPGARWGDVAAALRPHGWALSSGDSGGVGVGGLATAGGIGFLSRAHGLTIDRLRAVEVILADGSRVRASESEKADLFFGMRGAGFNFGIAVAFEFEVAEVGEIGFGRLVFDVTADIAGFLQRWGAAVEASPREVTSFLLMGGSRDGRFLAQTMTVVDSDDPDTIVSRLQPLAAVAPMVDRQVALLPYDALVSAGPRTGHAGSGEPAARSGLLTRVSADFARDAERLLRGGGTYFFQIRALGGATTDVAPHETAFAHRGAQFSVLAMGTPSRLDPLWEPMRSHFVGLYLSFETDRSAERLAEAFPPATLARLRDLKRRYDPENVFRDNFNIEPRAPGEPPR
ncbi:LLM class flavin-dependent oxidoreductase [Pseudactinotalea sp. HY158]|uniref:LLM class flavin-dependent oxidoreductase n=1 Tax=Pseudactinotalea sp. HY158 TaxID=2654547 RepID=UPI00129C793D|nr:LLM class flavin-dependent oxidoreductase [Pseudactinotalea sp. HY158]QGH68603.1 LLM class flavin-dependent oxidoreductase [Pseudactinotalea sp. HY158]